MAAQTSLLDGHPTVPPAGRQDRDIVRFRLRDACLPPANELLDMLWGGHVLEGQIVGRSRADIDEVVVIKVNGMEQLVAISVGNLLGGE